MKSLFRKPNRVAQLGRNGFDMSQRRIFTTPVGMLLPTYTDFLLPGDKVKLNSREFVRTQPLQSSAFVRMKAHLDWFFVPVTQLFSQWNQFYNGTNDNMSSMFVGSSTSPTFPTLKVNVLNSLESEIWSSSNKVNSALRDLLVDEFGVPLAWNARRLMMMLYPSTAINGNTLSGSINILSLLAYHKCFHSHYRNTDYTPNDPMQYNIDKYYNVSELPTSNFKKYFTIHYRPWIRDAFSFIQPAPIFGGSFADFLNIGGDSPASDLSRFFPEARNAVSASNQTGGVSGSDSPTFPLSGYGVSIKNASLPPIIGPRASITSSLETLSVGDIRAAFALDKLLRITAQAGSHYDEQTLAHFGYKMPQGIADEAYYLGEQSFDIAINEVVATASSTTGKDTSLLGEIAGRGFGATHDGKDLEFTAPCHGIVIAIHSISPLPDYRDEKDVVANKIYSFDFFHPEFDNIGMQPYGIDFAHLSSTQPVNILGWQYRYMEHKTKLDVSDESIYNTSLRTWALSRSRTYYGKDTASTGKDPAPDGKDIGPGFNVPLSGRFYIMPQYTNGIFYASFPAFLNPDSASAPSAGFMTFAPSEAKSWLNPQNKPQMVYGDDPFICVLEHKVYKTSVMSVYSLPRM